MLSKLLKYDLRANIKIFLFIWPAMLGMALARTGLIVAGYGRVTRFIPGHAQDGLR